MKVPALLLVSTLLAVDGRASAPSNEPSQIKPERLDTGADALRWDAGQYLQADRKGRVFVFRADTLGVYPVDAKGQLGEPTRLVVAGSDPNASRRITHAALAPAGDDWLLSPFMGQPLWFPAGREKPLPSLPQHPSAVGFVGSTPVIAVLPLGQGQSASPPTLPGENPLLLELSGTEWRVRTRFDYAEPEAGAFNRQHVSTWARVLGARRLAARGDGKLWVAHVHAYRLELQTSAGRKLVEMQVGPDHGEVRAHSEAEVAEIEAALKSRNLPVGPGASHGLRADPVIIGLAAGRDDRAYLVGRAGGRFFLDRFDPSSGELTRLELTGLEGNNFTLAAGSGALYLASVNGLAGRWRIDWASLEAAEWQRVQGARVDGNLPTPQ